MTWTLIFSRADRSAGTVVCAGDPEESARQALANLPWLKGASLVAIVRGAPEVRFV